MYARFVRNNRYKNRAYKKKKHKIQGGLTASPPYQKKIYLFFLYTRTYIEDKKEKSEEIFVNKTHDTVKKGKVLHAVFLGVKKKSR